ncbi:MAG: hypothetical protein HY436_00255 [Candidatus Liptonbacteria bacterium]|nr:hypothetical protein [Candidatus Liptonbacteria bacterium]
MTLVNKGQQIIVGIVVVVALLLLLYWLFVARKIAPPAAPGVGIGVESREDASLGSELFERSQNPLSGRLDTINPTDTLNPLGGIRVNPFE